jgi:hypothetical protein
MNICFQFSVYKECRISFLSTFQREGTFDGVSVQRIAEHLSRLLPLRHASLETASSVFTAIAPEQNRLFMVQSILDTNSSSALLLGRALFVLVCYVRKFFHIGLRTSH